MEAYLVWGKFVICALVIFFAGKQVARYGDIIAERTGLGRVWIGVILISLITSLPELFNGISAVTLVKAPDLVVGDLIGANAFNLLNLALLDIMNRGQPLLTGASATHRLTGWFSTGMMLLVAFSIVLGRYFPSLSLGWIGFYSPLIIIFYLLAIWKIFSAEREVYTAEAEIYCAEASTGRVYLYFSIAAAFIIAAGIWLAVIGEEISRYTGLGQSFVGSLFLAFSTTLPEITVSFTAMRLGATDMAVANMIGSNLFNLTIIPVADLFYGRPLLSHVSPGHLITAGAVLLMTLLFISALHLRVRRYFRLSWWNLPTILIFAAAAYLSFLNA